MGSDETRTLFPKKLYDFLENVFIPNSMVIMKNKRTGQIVPTIDIDFIIKLKRSEEDNRKIMNYLNERGIVVYGYSEDIDSELENDYHFTAYQKAILPKPFTPDEMMDQFKIYAITRDPVIREQLIIQNLNQVPYIAWKYARKYDFSFEQLESFGYEGLIIAVDKFDVTKGFQFATYAQEIITGYIKNGLVGSVGIYDKNGVSNNLVMCKNIVETKRGCKLEDYPEEMKKEIIELMISKYNYPDNEEKRQELEKLININCIPEPFENSSIECDWFSTFEDSTSNEAIHEQLQKDLNDILMKMPNPRTRKIIQLYYGLDGQKPKLLTEIASILGITSSGVRQHYISGIRKLRFPAIRKGMEDYLDSYEMNPDSEYNVKKER